MGDFRENVPTKIEGCDQSILFYYFCRLDSTGFCEIEINGMFKLSLIIVFTSSLFCFVCLFVCFFGGEGEYAQKSIYNWPISVGFSRLRDSVRKNLELGCTQIVTNKTKIECQKPCYLFIFFIFYQGI